MTVRRQLARLNEPPATSLHNSRGAAFLLSVYVAALMLLLLGGVSLQRSTVDVRSAQVSRDMGQAFFLAEAGLDHALRSDLEDGTYRATLPTGRYTYAITTSEMAVTPERLRLLKTITSTGTASGRQSSIVATKVVEQSPLPGAVYANGVIRDPSGGCGAWVYGNAHSGRGMPGSALLDHPSWPTDRIFGNLSVDPPDATSPYDSLWGAGSPSNLEYGRNPAVMFTTAWAGTSSSWTPERWAQWVKEERVVGGTLSAVSLLPMLSFRTPASVRGEGSAVHLKLEHNSRLERLLTRNSSFWSAPENLATYASDPAAYNLTAGDFAILNLYDDGGSRDWSPAGDGKIVLRLRTLQLWPFTQLVLHAPTQIYVERAENLSPRWWQSPGVRLPSTNIPTAVYVGMFSSLVAVDSANQTIKNGVKIFVTQNPSGDPPGAVITDAPNAFFGSIWAPESDVAVIAKSFTDPRPNALEDTMAAINSWREFQGDPPLTGDALLRAAQEQLHEGTNLCPSCPGGRDGAEYGYIVGNTVYMGGEFRVGTDEFDDRSKPETRRYGLGYWAAAPPNASDSGILDPGSATAADPPTISFWGNTLEHLSP